MRRLAIVGLTILAVASLSGCGDTPENVARVSGKVTLDGAPLPDALVEFNPIGASGSPSVGRTDENGYYELSYSRNVKGAHVGEHTVRISTFKYGDPEADPPSSAVPEKVPAEYNVESKLKAKVEEGSNTIDFELQSGGEIISPDAVPKRPARKR